MNAENFIIDELEKFIKIFPKVRVQYEHHEMSRSHFIEIVPSDIFHSNNDLQEWEYLLFEKFVFFYPTENICFISDDDLVNIENVIYIKEGFDYAPISTVEKNIVFDPFSVSLQPIVMKTEINITFTDTKKHYFIEETQVPQEYSSKTYILAA